MFDCRFIHWGFVVIERYLLGVACSQYCDLCPPELKPDITRIDFSNSSYTVSHQLNTPTNTALNSEHINILSQVIIKEEHLKCHFILISLLKLIKAIYPWQRNWKQGEFLILLNVLLQVIWKLHCKERNWPSWISGKK